MIIIVFGVTGVGKTVVGSLLAAELGWSFYDADLYHSAPNIDKMRQGVPLTEQDRGPWLKRLCLLIDTASQAKKDAVLACSALRESYRRQLVACAETEVRLVYLKGDFDLIHARLMQRLGHFMPPELLQSQFDTLEEPRDGTLVVDVRPPPEQIVRAIRKELQL